MRVVVQCLTIYDLLSCRSKWRNPAREHWQLCVAVDCSVSLLAITVCCHWQPLVQCFRLFLVVAGELCGYSIFLLVVKDCLKGNMYYCFHIYIAHFLVITDTHVLTGTLYCRIVWDSIIHIQVHNTWYSVLHCYMVHSNFVKICWCWYMFVHTLMYVHF